MMTIRRAEERGHFDHGWLKTWHSFSFADYRDPRHMGFRALRVINEDRVAPRRGFAPHPHRDMEILTYMLSGSLSHEDSLGNGSTVRRGQIQRMSAGTGIVHSERNPSADREAHLLQIWLLPATRGIAPSWEERDVAVEAHPGRLLPIATPDGRDGSARISQDVEVLAARLPEGVAVSRDLAEGRHAWVQVAAGGVAVAEGPELRQGDGLALSEERSLVVTGAPGGAEILLFDLA